VKGIPAFEQMRILLAGCGSIGKRHARVLRELGIQHLTACDPDGSKLEELRAQQPGIEICESFSAGLKRRPDAAFILTPPKLHVPMAIQALEAGCHVFSEKPISDSLDKIDVLSALAAETGRKVMVGLCFRFHEGLRKAKELVCKGTIGRLVSIRSLIGEHLPDVRPDYKTLFSAQYSGAFDLMHDIDLALWYAKQPVRKVKAFSGRYSDVEIDAPDLAEILIDFQDRCMATVHLDFFQRPRRRQIELIGVAGVICIEFARWDEYTLSIYSAAAGKWEHLNGRTRRDDMFRDEDSEFLGAVSGSSDITCTIEEATQSLRVVLAAESDAII
jgi:predicted dehydrogenase